VNDGDDDGDDGDDGWEAGGPIITRDASGAASI
jgi:hypothetical protein